MSFTTQTNKWSPRVIIIFQLTVWTAVGIILLRKGAKSLRDIQDSLRNDTADTQISVHIYTHMHMHILEKKKSESTKASGTLFSQETIARRSEKELIEESSITENRDRIAEIATQRNDVATALNNSEALRRNKIWLSLKPYASYRADSIAIKKRTTSIDRKQDLRGVRAIQTLWIRASNENKDEQVENKTGAVVHNVAQSIQSDDTTNLYDTEENASLQSTEPDSTNLTSQTGNDKIGRKVQRAPVNRIGVAVAITMLAIGVVMLLLGPLIVILRAYSDRRRSTQIFLKSRCHSDRPPTYEEVVLMDQAPRYSTLQLDTITESSPSL
ncbi:uncharacterized protein LOC143216122 isoform X1 [Lasioglossum baleicum]|uniref:uncharacterized protein LOC143216122 isoform X1 n=1 Tax=Lasioglossum baleicum TaxID=434251 RepID=UPI003FCDB48E